MEYLAIPVIITLVVSLIILLVIAGLAKGRGDAEAQAYEAIRKANERFDFFTGGR